MNEIIELNMPIDRMIEPPHKSYLEQPDKVKDQFRAKALDYFASILFTENKALLDKREQLQELRKRRQELAAAAISNRADTLSKLNLNRTNDAFTFWQAHGCGVSLIDKSGSQYAYSDIERMTQTMTTKKITSYVVSFARPSLVGISGQSEALAKVAERLGLPDTLAAVKGDYVTRIYDLQIPVNTAQFAGREFSIVFNLQVDEDTKFSKTIVDTTTGCLPRLPQSFERILYANRTAIGPEGLFAAFAS